MMTMQTSDDSAGLWTLAWRRLRADRVAMAALAVVASFLLLVLLSSTGLVAADWEDEVAVNYAPPSFVGADATARALAQAQLPRATPPNAFDPLAAELAALQAQVAATHPPVAKRTTLLFGADKWGHDIVRKTIKGGETSIVVGLVAALLAVTLGTLFGAVAGFFGGWVDDLFNWYYSIFTSNPSILMIFPIEVTAVPPAANVCATTSVSHSLRGKLRLSLKVLNSGDIKTKMYKTELETFPLNDSMSNIKVKSNAKKRVDLVGIAIASITKSSVGNISLVDSAPFSN